MSVRCLVSTSELDRFRLDQQQQQPSQPASRPRMLSHIQLSPCGALMNYKPCQLELAICRWQWHCIWSRYKSGNNEYSYDFEVIANNSYTYELMLTNVQLVPLSVKEVSKADVWFHCFIQLDGCHKTISFLTSYQSRVLPSTTWELNMWNYVYHQVLPHKIQDSRFHKNLRNKSMVAI